MLTGIANSEGPGQTAPEGAVWPGSTLFAYPIASSQVFIIFRTFAVIEQCQWRGIQKHARGKYVCQISLTYSKKFYGS